MNNSYEPIPIRPLTMRGVLGITWTIVKRGFFSAAAYAAAWTIIAILVLGLCALPAILGVTSGNAPQMAALAVLSVVLMFVFSLAMWLVINPILSGGLYTEMSMRLYGQSSSLSALFKRTGFTLRRFFTLNLCQSLGQAVAGIAASMISSVLYGIVAAGGMFGTVMSAMRSGLFERGMMGSLEETISLGAGFMAVMVITALVSAGIGLCASVPLALTYPVAVNEGKKNFDALGRGLDLGFRRFGRILCATLIAMLAFMLIEVIICAIFGIAIGACAAAGSTAAVIVLAVATAVVMLLLGAGMSAYTAALNTVLYHDAHARELAGTGEPVRNAVTADADAGESAPEAQNEPAAPASEEPEFVEKDDCNDTNNTQE